MIIRSLRLVPIALAAASVAACSGAPFVDRNYMTVTVSKEKLPGARTGEIKVCYNSDTTPAAMDALANEACDVFGLKAVLVNINRWQCRLTVPHLASYRCVDPNRRFADGHYVDLFSKQSVMRWRREQAPQKAGGMDAGGAGFATAPLTDPLGQPLLDEPLPAEDPLGMPPR